MPQTTLKQEPASVSIARVKPGRTPRAERIARKLALLDELESLLATVPQDAAPLRDDAVRRSY